MKLDDFKNIDFKNAGSLPWPVKAVLLLGAALLVLGAGYWFLLMPQIETLTQARAKEEELRKVFLEKKAEAINLEAYKAQMTEIEQLFGALLKQLPDKAQMDSLLNDINQAALNRGLDVELFKPGQEVIGDFYAELPIAIKVKGSYFQLGGFATDVSKLPRIVIINDINVTQPKDAKDNGANADGKLVMEAVAKTYRYLDGDEIASKKKAEKSAAKK